MKVLLINGSPHKYGCTNAVLEEVMDQLRAESIETELLHIGTKPVGGCIDCGGCIKTGLCVFKNDNVNVCIEKLCAADGIIVGSPVYYAGPNGSLCAFMDRVFAKKKARYAFKPAAAVLCCRRGGASASFDRLNKYFSIAHMPIVPSQYWNSVHGMTPDEIKQDLEGLQTMRMLARNMAWMLKCIDNAKGKVPLPDMEPWVSTNFIR